MANLRREMFGRLTKSLARLRPWTLAQTNPWAAAVFVDEFDAGRSKVPSHLGLALAAGLRASSAAD
jgi:hypothetical protein